MSKLGDLKAVGEKVTLTNGMELTIRPITISDEIEVAEFQAEDKFFQALTVMVKNAIKKAVPDATDEEIDELNKEDLKALTDVVLRVNGLDKKKDEAMKS